MNIVSNEIEKRCTQKQNFYLKSRILMESSTCIFQTLDNPFPFPRFFCPCFLSYNALVLFDAAKKEHWEQIL